MPDESWRAQERMWLANPGDQDALQRAIAARRRAGLPVPAWMLEKQVHAARTFDSDHELHVFAQLPDGRTRGLGRTPCEGGVAVPEHRALWVQPASPTDRSLKALAADEDLARALPGLALGPDVTDEGLAHLKAFPALTRLDLAGCTKVGAAGLQHVASAWALETLDLWSALKVDDAALAHVAALGGLVTLNLRHCKNVTPAGVAHLARLESLAVLALGGCTKVGDAALEPLGALPQLTALDLSGCPITDKGVGWLAALPELTILNLSSTRVSVLGLAALCDLPKLAQLYILGCGDASQVAAKALARKLPKCEVISAG